MARRNGTLLREPQAPAREAAARARHVARLLHHWQGGRLPRSDTVLDGIVDLSESLALWAARAEAAEALAARGWD